MTDADVTLVVEKVSAALAQGDQCMGMAFGKSAPEWKEIFNAAARTLGIPVVHVEPLKSGGLRDISKHATDLQAAFRQSADGPVIVVADASGNNKIADPRTGMQLANFIEGLSRQYAKAVYVQVVTDAAGNMPVTMYCMNPKTPRDPAQPILPV